MTRCPRCAEVHDRVPHATAAGLECDGVPQWARVLDAISLGGQRPIASVESLLPNGPPTVTVPAALPSVVAVPPDEGV